MTHHADASPLAQRERQRQATRPGPVVRGTFSPSGRWRPAVVARLARTLGSTKATVRHPSGKCACRRELNSHDAAKPRDGTLPMLRPPQQMDSDQSRIEASLCQFLGRPVRNRSTRRKSPAERLGAAVPHRASGMRGKRRSSISSSGRRGRQGHFASDQ